MTLDSDILVDRRRLKRRLIFWRILAILAIVAAVALAATRSGPAGIFGLGGDHIARISIGGLITDNRARHELLDKLKKDHHVKAVIVSVDSPGGTTSGGEALYEDLRAIAKEKPTAAVFGTAATSAAYLGGIATDYIVARGNTITGSVGVIFQWAEVSDLLSKIGVKVDEIRSGPLKAKPSPFSPSDDEARRLSEELVSDSQRWFLGLVAERRKQAVSSMDEIKTGRIYTGRQALQIGLIDAVGDESTAIKWFSDQKNVKADLKVFDWKPEGSGATNLFRSAMASLAAEFGLGWLFSGEMIAGLDPFGERPLDGLFSIWHPQLGKSETPQ